MRLSIIGIGPGDPKYLTAEAQEALYTSEVVVGYPLYLSLIADIIKGKTLFQTPMRQEIERCRMALDAASSGRITALVCGGDPGVYGMAGPVYELSPRYPDVEILVIPGITAALGGAALLGAPLGHDFAVISQSKACGILLEILREDTVCGVVRNAGRFGEDVSITTLRKLKDEEADMFTTLFIGNSRTKVINGKMVTPRGYAGA